LSFSAFALSPETLQSIRDRGHREPTPIQSGAIPVALTGRDLVATAGTGSGKTAAFLLPMLNRLRAQRGAGVTALILAPTRELAAQIGHEADLLSRDGRVRKAVIVGGESMHRQIADLRAADYLIACPGRLIDHLERGTVRLDRVTMVVIDEADRMLDMGFLPQLRRIMRALKAPRQTLMFSATMDGEVERIAREFLRDPARVNIGKIAAPPATIRHAICPVEISDKGPLLLELMKRPEVESAIVFTRTRSRADRVTRLLARGGVSAAAIHGDRSQNQRSAALSGFRRGSYRVLVATDIAARGLDIPDVSHVINFDLPDASDTYIHRIGRTARMGKSGEALTLVTPEERNALGDLEKRLGHKLERTVVAGFKPPALQPQPPVRPAATAISRPGSGRRQSRRDQFRAR
jgi:ATP-dependent RNA helicase RhlE